MACFSKDGPGRAYLGFLRDLALLQSDHFEVPQLRQIAGPTMSAAEFCATQAATWRAAHFEGSPLTELEAFEPTPSALDACNTALHQFAEAERERQRLLESTAGGLETDDAEPGSRWLAQHESSLHGLSAGARERLAVWSPLFREGERGPKLLEKLANLIEQVSKLDFEHHQDEFFELFIEMDPPDLLQWSRHAGRASRPAHSLLARLNPMRGLAIKKVNRQLKALAEAPTPERRQDFANMASLELALAPIRTAWKALCSPLSVAPQRPNVVTFHRMLREYHAELVEVAQAVSALSVCPFPEAARQAVAGSQLFGQFLPLVQGALARCRARQSSRKALAQLDGYLHGT